MSVFVSSKQYHNYSLFVRKYEINRENQNASSRSRYSVVLNINLIQWATEFQESFHAFARFARYKSLDFSVTRFQILFLSYQARNWSSRKDVYRLISTVSLLPRKWATHAYTMIVVTNLSDRKCTSNQGTNRKRRTFLFVKFYVSTWTFLRLFIFLFSRGDSAQLLSLAQPSDCARWRLVKKTTWHARLIACVERVCAST